ncbi:MAG: DUF7455 domain-containing protein [Candidatus Nanopelagicales bacterium]
MTATLSPTLTAADRCDRCGAQAITRARMASGLELLFCGHHTRAHRSVLEVQAAEVVIDDVRPESALVR